MSCYEIYATPNSRHLISRVQWIIAAIIAMISEKTLKGVGQENT